MEWITEYPVTLRPDDNGTVLVTFPDFPGATFGEDRADALVRAREFLIDAIEIYMARREPIPTPSTTGATRVAVPPSVALKLALYRAMLAQRVTKSGLAAKMDQPKQQVERLFKLRYRSRVDQIDAAFEAMRVRIQAVDVFDETATATPRRRRSKALA